MPREHVWVLRAKKLRVLGQPDVYQAFYRLCIGSRVVGSRVKRRELYAVPIDLADVEVLPDFRDLRSGDVVCGTPDALGGFVLACRQSC